MPAPSVHHLDAFNAIWLTGEADDPFRGTRYPITPSTYVDCYLAPGQWTANPQLGVPTNVKTTWTFNNAPGSTGSYFYFLVYKVQTPVGIVAARGAVPLPASLGAAGNFNFSIKAWQGVPLTITFWYVGLWLNARWFCLDSLPLDASLTPAVTPPSAPASIATPTSGDFLQQSLN